jgi:hypothetical protein
MKYKSDFMKMADENHPILSLAFAGMIQKE